MFIYIENITCNSLGLEVETHQFQKLYIRKDGKVTFLDGEVLTESVKVHLLHQVKLHLNHQYECFKLLNEIGI